MPLHRHHLHKADGRDLFLYSRAPFPAPAHAPSPGTRATGGGSHLRWHPLRGEWVVYAGHRQNRTFLPPAAWNPLAVTVDDDHPTELPAGAWDVAVFENLFPALGNAGDVPAEIVPTAPGQGRCEVVVYTQDPTASFGGLSLDRIALVVDVWAERTAELGRRDDVACVFPFENRGVDVGATLHHPHGQIYAYPFVPPILAREHALLGEHQATHGTGLLATMIAQEVALERRTLWVGEHALAWIPVCARWAYEIWVAPRQAVGRLDQLSADERMDLARALQRALRMLDGLWGTPMPYVLAIHQAPTRADHPHGHVHVEIYPWRRMRDRLKFLAGSEVGAGTFTADTLPEDKARELREVEVEP